MAFLGRWRTAAIDRTQLFMPVSDVEKRPISQFFFRLCGVIWRGKAFGDQQCQFLTRSKSLSSEKESNCSMTSECVRIDFNFAPRRRPRASVDVNSRFSRFQFSAFWSNGLASSVFIFCSDFVTVFFIVFVYARAKRRCYRFFLFRPCEKSYASSKPTR